MAFTIAGASLDTKNTKLTTTGVTEIFAANKRTTILSIVASEIAGATPDYTLEKYDGTTSHYIYFEKPLTANTPLIFNEPFVLGNNWKLRATAGTANQIDIAVTYALPDSTAQGGLRVIG